MEIKNFMEATVYNQVGKEIGTIKLPEAVFGVKWNADLVHQVIVGMQANLRTPIAHTKNRGEVSGGGKKPWRQKGTGRARHGSTRSPIWVGGGVAHGPRKDKIYAVKINRVMKAKALAMLLSQKLRDNEILFVDSIELKTPKTADARMILGAFAKAIGNEKLFSKKQHAAHIAVAKKDNAVLKSFRNISNVGFHEMRMLSPLDLANGGHVIIENPKESLPALSARLSSRKNS